MNDKKSLKCRLCKSRDIKVKHTKNGWFGKCMKCGHENVAKFFIVNYKLGG